MSDLGRQKYGQAEICWDTRPDISPLRYPGGKRKLAPLVARLAMASGRPVDLLVEPFAGGAAVTVSLLEAGAACEAVLADADPMISAFWKTVFSSEAGRLADLASQAVFSLEEWKAQKHSTPDSALAAAWKCLYLNRTSFSGSLMDYAGPMGGKSQSGPDRIGSRFNREAIAARILELSRLRGRIRFVNASSWQETASRVRTSLRDESVFWYLDPPYFAKARRLYQHSFTASDHERLAASLDGLPGSFALSYDDCPEAERLYGAHPGFSRVGMRYNARVDGGHRQVSEILVSDVIATARNAGSGMYGPVIQLEARRSKALRRMSLDIREQA